MPELLVGNNNELATELAKILESKGEELGSSNSSINSENTTFLSRVISTVKDPRDRWLSIENRNSSSIAAIGETIWVLAGRDDINFLEKFVHRAANYSDDGITWRGAYGKRMYKNDQLESVISRLKENNNSRQAYLSLYIPELDTDSSLIETIGTKHTKDFICNTTLYFNILKNKLNLTVCNRSNDISFGVCSINMIEFSIIQEIISEILDVELGEYTIFSNNLHYYHNERSRGHMLAYLSNTDISSNKSNKLCIGTIKDSLELKDFFYMISKMIENNEPFKLKLLLDFYLIKEKSLLHDMTYIAIKKYNNEEIKINEIHDEGLIKSLNVSKVDKKQLF